MKTMIFCMLTILLGKGCDRETREEMENAHVEYEAVSRGYYLNIGINDKVLTIKDQREANAREYRLTDADWRQLGNLFKSIEIKKLSEYKGPTQKRFYDGAAIANLRVVYDGQTYTTEGFDHMGPPPEIAEFVNKIVSFANQQNDN